MHATRARSDSPSPHRKLQHTDKPIDVAVIGAGIGGLTAAHDLKSAGLSVLVFEADAESGGVIRSTTERGFLVDSGPNTLLDTHQEVRDLLSDLDVLDRRIFPSDQSTARYVVRDSRLTPMPTGPANLLRSELFSMSAKLRLMGEPFVRRPDPTSADSPETVADFVRRRLGSEFLDYAVNPFVGGIHAGDPERLLVQHAFPGLTDTEAEHGSLIVGQIRGSRARKRRNDTPKQSARIYSFPHGITELSDALSRSVAESLRTSSPVTDISKDGDDFLLSVGSRSSLFDSGRHIRARHVVYAAGFRNTTLLSSLSDNPDDNRPPVLRYPPIAVVALGYKTTDIRHSLDGFGMLVPEIENRSILGTLFSSTLFSGRAPGGHALLTSFVGGDRRPDLARLPNDELQQLVHSDLAELLGIQSEPVFSRITKWPAAIPQYDHMYPKVKQYMTSLEHRYPGWHFVGNACSGISVPDTIRHARHQASGIIAGLCNTSASRAKPLPASS